MRLSDTLASTLRATVDNLLKTARERIDPAWVADACQRAELDGGRRRKLPPDSIVWMVIGACLLASHAFQDVVRYLGLTIPTARSNPQTVPSSGAVSDARTRLGDAVMRELFTISTNH